MSSIDKIMGAIGRHGDDCIRDGDAASESFEGLREMIAAALADARREGAEEMRMLAARVCDLNHHHCRERCESETGDSEDQYQAEMAKECAQEIRALPLPTGERKDEPLVCDVCGAECADPWHYSSGERRHMHACDACWPGVRKQGGGRQSVLLTDEQIEDALCRPTASPPWLLGSARAIEAASLAANNLEVRRG